MADRLITRETLLVEVPAIPEDPAILEDLGLIRDDDDLPSNESGNTPFAEIAKARMSRRSILAGLGAAAAFGLVGQNMVKPTRPRGRCEIIAWLYRNAPCL